MVVKMHKSTGAMTGYTGWPITLPGTTKSLFAGGVWDADRRLTDRPDGAALGAGSGAISGGGGHDGNVGEAHKDGAADAVLAPENSLRRHLLSVD